MTKYHPILFSTPMVQAILKNRKRKTRRTKGLELFNKNPDNWRYDGFDEQEKTHYMELISYEGIPTEKYFEAVCPYKVGDVLWVRETFTHGSDSYPFVFKANYETQFPSDLENIPPASELKWKPCIFMPKEACRIFLKIKSIKVERLHDISEQDSIEEGIEDMLFNVDTPATAYRNYMTTYKNLKNDHWSHVANDPVESFMSLWQKINGADSWNKNPFVWVYEFERIEKPLAFIV